MGGTSERTTALFSHTYPLPGEGIGVGDYLPCIPYKNGGVQPALIPPLTNKKELCYNRTNGIDTATG